MNISGYVSLVRRLGVLLAVLFLFVLSVSAPQANASSSLLKRFSGGGHLLGFAAGQVYVATGSHALRITFEGALRALPETVAAARDAQTITPLDVVTYHDVWDGITLEYRGASAGILESVYTLAPGAEIGAIRLRYNVPVTVNADGSLTMAFENGQMSESAPVAWQQVNEMRVPVSVAFETSNSSTVGFRAGRYNPALPLYIDPVLTWSTFVGGTGGDVCYDIVVDGSGNTYVTGFSSVSWGTPRRAHYTGTNYDSYVAKLDSGGSVVWNTFLGGSGVDHGDGLTLDGSGNVYVTGISTVSWGSPKRALTVNGGNEDGYAAKLDSNGNLLWNTFLGGTDRDFGYGMAVDAGSVYVAGNSYAGWGAPVVPFGGVMDAYIAKLDTDGNLTWSTFVGGTGQDVSNGSLVLDSTGNLYLGGFSYATWGTPVRAFTVNGVNPDSFVARVNSSGLVVWNTFLGGSGMEFSAYLGTDASGNVYAVGSNNSVWGAPLSNPGGGAVYAAKLDSGGNLLWNTFLGGSQSGYLGGVAVDRDGNVYVVGSSNVSWGSPLRAFTVGGSNADAYVAKLDTNGYLAWNTFLGGTGYDYGNGIAIGGNGNVYVAGESSTGWGSPLNLFSGGFEDGFVVTLPSDRTYADQAGVCGGNAPCYTVFQNALDNTLTTGAVTYYPGTFSGGVNLTENVTANFAGGGNVTLGGNYSQSAGTFNAPGANMLSFLGNFAGSGGTFNHNNGTVVFAKAGIQTLTGSVTFYNLTTNSGATLDVGSDIATVNGVLANNGVMKRTTPGQNVNNGGGAISFADARGFTTAQLTSTGADSLGNTSLVVEAHRSPGSCGSAAFADVPILRSFNITPANTTNIAATVRLYFAPEELNGLTADALTLYHCNGTSWDKLAGGTHGLDATTGYAYVELTGIHAFSPFAVGYQYTPTNATLSAFHAAVVKQGVRLKWQTANEMNVVGFNVWRQAGKGDWKMLNKAQIAAKQTGKLSGDKYSQADRTAKSGRTYRYKVEIVFADGHSAWSEVERVAVK